MEIEYNKVYDGDDFFVVSNPKNVFNEKFPNKCCLTCKHSDELYSYDGNKNHIGCWHASDECGEPDHRWCIDNGDKFRCTDWLDKNAKLTPKLNFWVCRCDWGDYFDFRIIADNGKGHVRVSFYPDLVMISDLFVQKDYRNKRYGTALLDYVDGLVDAFGNKKNVRIIPLENWEKDWYESRGYNVVDDDE